MNNLISIYKNFVKFGFTNHKFSHSEKVEILVHQHLELLPDDNRNEVEKDFKSMNVSEINEAFKMITEYDRSML